MTETAQQILHIQQVLGETLRRARQRLGWSRLTLAEHMGYQKPQRGAAKIAAWEQGRALPRGDRPEVLERTLGLAEATLGVQVAAAHQVQSQQHRDQHRRRRWDLMAVDRQLHTLRRQCAFLLPRRHAIEQRPDWFDARVLGAGVGVAYLGGGPLRLGDLLALWARDDFTVPSPCCDAALRLYYAAGSPLSGRNTVAGFCEGCLVEHHLRLDRDPPFVDLFRPALARVRAHSTQPSLLILEDVVRELGGEPRSARTPRRQPPTPTLLPRDPFQHDHNLVVDPGDGDPFEIWHGNPYGARQSIPKRRRYLARPGHLVRPDNTVAARYPRVQSARALAAAVLQSRAAGDR